MIVIKKMELTLSYQNGRETLGLVFLAQLVTRNILKARSTDQAA